MDGDEGTAGNPLNAAKSVWFSSKFRTACTNALAVILSSFLSGFLAALIPKLGADQIASVMQWVATLVGGGFMTAIGGAAYVDGQHQAAAGTQKSIEVLAKSQAIVKDAQSAAISSMEAATVAKRILDEKKDPR